MKPKYGSPEYCLEEAKKQIDKALEQVSKIRDDIGVIMPVESISYKGIYSLDCYYKGSYYGGRFDVENRIHLENAYKNAINFVDEELKRIEEIHESNKSSIENNINTKQKIINFMTTIGISSDYTVWEYPTSRSKTKKSIPKRAGYLSDIERCIKTLDGYDSVKRQYEEAKKKFKESYKKYIKVIELKEKEREKATKEEENRQALARFQVKYDTTGSWNDILDIILSKDQYLLLGHYLLMNRNDWNDGCSYAEFGLRSFVADTDMDQKIYDEINDLIENWDGDGRCFRDSQFGYDYLFSLVDDEKLIKDYNEVYTQIDY